MSGVRYDRREFKTFISTDLDGPDGPHPFGIKTSTSVRHDDVVRKGFSLCRLTMSRIVAGVIRKLGDVAMDAMNILERHAVTTHGSGDRTLVFLHGYGCDSTMWDAVVPRLQTDFQIVKYDLIGCGKSDLTAYDKSRYSTLEGHAQDLADILAALSLEAPVLIGHSVSAMTVALAANALGGKIGDVIMVCPSPSFINEDRYVGGFEREDIDDLLETLEGNYLGWSSQMAPAIMGAPEQPHLGERLTNSFCQADPDIARHFARVTFLSDHRKDVRALAHRTLVLECRDDVIVPPEVGRWMDDALENGELVVLNATGHCPHISAPDETVAAIRTFLNA